MLGNKIYRSEFEAVMLKSAKNEERSIISINMIEEMQHALKNHKTAIMENQRKISEYETIISQNIKTINDLIEIVEKLNNKNEILTEKIKLLEKE